MSGACSTCSRQERCIQDFEWEILRKRNHLEGLGVNGEDNIKMDIEEVG